MTFVVIFNFRQPPNAVKTYTGGKAYKRMGCKPSNEADRLLDVFYLRIAAIPGSSIPSKYSSIAPPPVET